MTVPDTYRVYARNAYGREVGNIANFISLNYTLTNNAIGNAGLTVRQSDLPSEIATKSGWSDAILEVWRSNKSNAEQYEGTFIIQDGVSYRTGSTVTVELAAVDARTLLDWRLVLPGTATKTGNADNIAKDFVREHAGTSAAAGRAYPASLFSVAGNTGAAPSVTLNASGKTLLQTVSDLCMQSAQAATPMFFDVQMELGVLVVRTYTVRRGILREGFTFSQTNNTLQEVRLIDTTADARSFVYATGAGQGAQQLLGQASDAVLIANKPFGRREILVNASSAKTQAEANAEAALNLRRYRPSSSLSATVANLPGSSYGEEWRHGDHIYAAEQSRVFLCSIDTVSVSINRTGQKVAATARSLYEL